MNQKHLTYKEMVNLGSYYTKPELVDIVYDLLLREIPNRSEYAVIDTSCGYGSFLIPNHNFKEKIGTDIDETSISKCKETIKDCELILHNSLLNVSRERYHLTPDDKIVIVGNPPYNDTTSQTHQKIKEKVKPQIDEDLKRRDLGISFLVSYDKLKSDYVCVLHPLSYWLY